MFSFISFIKDMGQGTRYTVCVIWAREVSGQEQVVACHGRLSRASHISEAWKGNQACCLALRFMRGAGPGREDLRTDTEKTGCPYLLWKGADVHQSSRGQARIPPASKKTASSSRAPPSPGATLNPKEKTKANLAEELSLISVWLLYDTMPTSSKN